jgi:N-acetylmuramoyl-L-alanine amidase
MIVTTVNSLLRPVDLDMLARTLWGEARGEGREGQIAVAWVIRNRAEDPGKDWWGDTVAEVCHKPFQFSCWDKSDPNRTKLCGPSIELPGYDDLYEIGCKVMVGDIPDPTGSATHYKVTGTAASWDAAAAKVNPVIIGRHSFYRLGPSA